MIDKHDNSLDKDLQGVLRDSEDDIDELTLARIRAARMRALDAIPQRHGRRWLIPASAAAAIMLTVSVVMLSSRVQVGSMVMPNGEVAVLEDIEILTEQGSIELLQDLEFYEWLDGHVDNTV